MFISPIIINWYKREKRDLPWRNTKDPYKIWLSEIILQQTRVAQGTEYYHRFVEKFPTIVDLANANEEDVLKLWQGLGYYSRARNLHKTAQQVRDEYKGVFPKKHDEIRQLKGIGDYTAAAIGSFAFNLPYAAVDGNVYRVLSRIFGIETAIDSSCGKKEFALLANELLDKKNPADFNQAMMEFGAMQCIPKKPNCSICVVNQACLAHKNKKVAELPVKSKKTQQRTRYFYYFVVKDKNLSVLLHKRIEKDIWKHLYEFPLVELEQEMEIDVLLRSELFKTLFDFKAFELKSVSKQYKHILSHQIIKAIFVELRVSKHDKKSKFIIANKKAIESFAVSRLTHLFLEDNLYLTD